MAYIAKHKDKWRAQVAKLGVRKTAVFDTKREAVEWANRTELEISKGVLKKSANTLQQAITKYLETVSVTKRDAVVWERCRFGAMLDYFGDVPLSEVTTEAIGEWRTERLKQVSGSTILRESGLYRNLFRVAGQRATGAGVEVATNQAGAESWPARRRQDPGGDASVSHRAAHRDAAE